MEFWSKIHFSGIILFVEEFVGVQDIEPCHKQHFNIFIKNYF